MVKRKALGKGLSALIPEANDTPNNEGSGFFQCPIEDIEPNPYQPRQEFDNEALKELTASIKEKGVITPVLVSRSGDGYRLIAGERRWRAAQKAGLDRIPVVVRESTPIESLELALIENIHRRDLNPIEEASAYKRWLEDAETTQEILAQRVGKDRSTIANLLRLLSLSKDIQKDIIDGRLSMGHARVLAGLKDVSEQKRIRDIIIKKDLSVRQTETLAKKGPSAVHPGEKSHDPDEYLLSLSNGLKRSLGTKVEIKKKGKKGSINIYFFSDDEFDRLLDRLSQ
ncbi:MAG: ParB/RepB/Spo0J family partition protein [Deltaproteobacteria bacterium]|nr:ParB/RepB/Spo0J family partition protein [Deltaproteobacteria bacterium]